ncbi:MAG: FlgO family outer membrane protein [Candidatus Sericytochromatia bacterium]
MLQRPLRGIALTLACVSALSLTLPAWSQTPVPEIYRIAQQAERKALAVVDFENLTGESRYDNLRRGIAESLMSKLTVRPELALVERGQLDKAIKELGFSQSAYADSSGAKELGQMAGADYLVAGAVVKAGGRFEINVRLIEVATARVLVSEAYAFQSESDILPVVDYLALRLPKQMGLYVSERELEMARGRLRAETQMMSQMQPAQDLGWLWWTLGGVVLAGTAIAVAVILSRPQQNINQTVTIGERLQERREDRNNLGALPLLRF